MPDALETPTRLINEIGQAVVNDPAYARHDWESLALVIRCHPGVVQTHGFAYCADGSVVPEIPDLFEIGDLFEGLHTAMAEVSDRPWVTALLQIRRDTGKASFNFEFDDVDRWRVTPFNLEEMRETLRPG